MNTILMAAARGARIQVLLKPESKWIPAFAVRCDEQANSWTYRIHPADEHLRFGPVSTALRGMAKTPKQYHFHSLIDTPYFGFTIEHETYEEIHELLGSSELVHSLFILILSEALAEEGL